MRKKNYKRFIGYFEVEILEISSDGLQQMKNILNHEINPDKDNNLVILDSENFKEGLQDMSKNQLNDIITIIKEEEKRRREVSSQVKTTAATA